VQAFSDGANAIAVGLIAAVAVQLGRAAIVDWPAALIALAAFAVGLPLAAGLARGRHRRGTDRTAAAGLAVHSGPWCVKCSGSRAWGPNPRLIALQVGLLGYGAYLGFEHRADDITAKAKRKGFNESGHKRGLKSFAKQGDSPRKPESRRLVFGPGRSGGPGVVTFLCEPL